MPRRDNGQARRAVTRGAYAILVYCGGTSTEVAYLDGLRQAIRPACAVKVVGERVDPLALIRHARARVDRHAGAYDEVWCVFDVDQFERDGGRVSAAIQVARELKISLAISQPCFEFWLLLHHDQCQMPFTNCTQVAVRLRQSVPGYDKRQLRFADFIGFIDGAIKRAKSLDPTAQDHLRNPSTSMWRLVERILEHKP